MEIPLRYPQVVSPFPILWACPGCSLRIYEGSKPDPHGDKPYVLETLIEIHEQTEHGIR